MVSIFCQNCVTLTFLFLKGFLKARTLDPNTPTKVIKEELEPTEFKQYFSNWETTVPFGMTRTYHAGAGIVTKGTIMVKISSNPMDWRSEPQVARPSAGA